MSVLQMGSRGQQVVLLQQALNDKLFPNPNLNLDGAFGNMTKNAVCKFQQHIGIKVDGIVGPQTQSKLANAPSAGPIQGEILRKGSRGDSVRQVQTLLNEKLTPSPGLVADGDFGNKTYTAVVRFQKQANLPADGFVGAQTLNALKNAQRPAGPQPGIGAPVGGGAGQEFFPFATVTSYDWSQSYRAFASNRSNGSRAHAGCDLYYPTGTNIYAIKDGTVLRGPYYFYADTYAIEINHGSFVARYGEIQQTAQVAAGDSVTAGQHIAQVGHLVGISVPSDMLHFEMYSGSGSGNLTDKTSSSAKRADGVSFQRRSDLIDPTPYLNSWQSNLPV